MKNSHEKAKAGDNETTFIDFFKFKYGQNSLDGKKSYRDMDSDVQISVDQSFIANNRTILIEIDSGNMAKLLVGQYVLVNEISELKPENTVFVVIHFYKGYNPERTKKNLNLVSNNLYEGNSIPHCALTFSDFKKLCKKCQDIASLETALTNKCAANL